MESYNPDPGFSKLPFPSPQSNPDPGISRMPYSPENKNIAPFKKLKTGGYMNAKDVYDPYMPYMEHGGALKRGQELYMNPNEVAAFMAMGGEIEFLD